MKVVSADMDANVANEIFGDRYGVDWAYSTDGEASFLRKLEIMRRALEDIRDGGEYASSVRAQEALAAVDAPVL